MIHSYIAKIEDIPQILSIMEENLLATNKDKVTQELERDGFLLYRFTESELKDIINNHSDHLTIVLKSREEILGYAIGHNFQWYRSKNWEIVSSIPEKYIAILNSEKNYYHRQIAVKKGHKGIGNKILSTVFNKVLEQGFDNIIAEIVHKPFKNERSIACHQKMGFKIIGTSLLGDFTTGVYFKQMNIN